MDSRQLREYRELTEPCLLMMNRALDELGLSPRAYDKVRRVARILAHLDGSERIGEAVQYRLRDRKF